jgi:hypothetical protein
MRCHEVRKHTSEFIDRFLGEAERERVLEHVASCAECREHLEATRRVIWSLRSLPTPAPAADFCDRAILAIDREAEPAMTIVTRRHFRLKPRYAGTLPQILRQILLTYEFNLISYGVALCISLVVFTWLLLSLRPVLSIAPFQAPSTEVVWVDSKQAEVLADSRIPDVYALPRISNGETVLHYPGEIASPDPDDLVVIAEVTTDGRGSIVQVLNGPPDQRAVGELASALGRPRTFVPARATTGMPIPSRVVLGFYRVDIWG